MKHNAADGLFTKSSMLTHYLSASKGVLLAKREKGTTSKLALEDNQLVQSLIGEYDENLKFIEKALKVKINARGNDISIHGEADEVELTRRLLQELYFLLESKHPIYHNEIDYAIKILKDNKNAHLKEVFLDTIHVSPKQRLITPKSVVQKQYIDAIRKYDIVISIGPAGTGKTYLAMAMAISSLIKKEIDRIILTRPAVEAGEKLGFLPGDLYEKVNPYLRPLYDALHDMVDLEKASRLLQKGIIEVAPLAFMRGRTLNDSFVILDEAQNTTSEQMKMFLTRLGFSSKAVITGDITQTDLPSGRQSGLKEIQSILPAIEGIKFVYFSEKDVVRHPLVQEIIVAYERAGSRLNNRET
jgi:phosphate starvation-inducible PhoH-like protein